MIITLLKSSSDPNTHFFPEEAMDKPAEQHEENLYLLSATVHPIYVTRSRQVEPHRVYSLNATPASECCTKRLSSTLEPKGSASIWYCTSCRRTSAFPEAALRPISLNTLTPDELYTRAELIVYNKTQRFGPDSHDHLNLPFQVRQLWEELTAAKETLMLP